MFYIFCQWNLRLSTCQLKHVFKNQTLKISPLPAHTFFYQSIAAQRLEMELQVFLITEINQKCNNCFGLLLENVEFYCFQLEKNKQGVKVKHLQINLQILKLKTSTLGIAINAQNGTQNFSDRFLQFHILIWNCKNLSFSQFEKGQSTG